MHVVTINIILFTTIFCFSLYHLLMEVKINCDLMDIFHDTDIGSTRGTPEGFTHGQTSGSQQPPPPPPNLAEVMAL